MSYTEGDGFTVGSAFQALQGLVLKLQWASESHRGLSKAQMARWAPRPCGLWPTRSGDFRFQTSFRVTLMILGEYHTLRIIYSGYVG